MLKVDGLIDVEWQKISIIENIPTSETIYTIKSIPKSTRQLRLTFIREGWTNLVLDDVEIITGGISRSILENYNNLNVGATTSFIINNLSTGETGFYYKIRAFTLDGNVSLFSKNQYVDWNSTSIQENSTNSEVLIVNIDEYDNINCRSLQAEIVSIYPLTADNARLL